MIQDYILISKIKNGDTDAWETLVHKYYDKVYFYCVRRCYGNCEVASDLTQDVFLKIVENIQYYRFTGKFYNYLYTIAVNICNNYCRKKRFVQCELTDEILLITENSVANKLLQNETNLLIQKALDKLPEIQREALILKYYHDLKVKDIANITGVNVSTAQSRIHQGLKKMSKILNMEELNNE